MRIVELRSENIKNLKVVDITPANNEVVLTGANGAGKSAVLDSIHMALTNEKINQPIRNGESRAEINVDVGQYKIKRIYTQNGCSLKVTTAEGAIITSPQKMLDEILGNLSFDPLAFAELGKNVAGQREQRNILAKLVNLDFTELDKERQGLYNERTIKHRLMKGSDSALAKPDPYAPLPLEALVSKMKVPDINTPRTEIGMSAIIANIRGLEEIRAEYIAKKHEIENQNNVAVREHEHEIGLLHSAIESDKKKLNDIAIEIEQIKKMLNTKILQLDEINAEINKEEQQLANAKNTPIAILPLPVETVTEGQLDNARYELQNIETQNIKIREAIEYDQKNAEIISLRSEISEIESKMMALDLEKKTAVDTAKFPISGLGITDQYITYGNKPFSQLSTGEKIRVSTAIAMALNPTLKVILIRDGSLLDSKGKKEIFDLAKEKDYQVWIEVVADNKGVGIYLSDGEIVE